MNSQDNSGKYIDFFTVKLLTSDEGLYKSEFISISILLFSSIGIISPGRMHLYLVLLFHRDYFGRPDASLSSSFVPQGLFRPPGCISIGLFCSTEITLPRADASLSGSFVPQGLFRPAECISIWLFCSTGIISPG